MRKGYGKLRRRGGLLRKEGSSSSMAHLLIVDDDPLIRKALVKTLAGAHTCVTACNGLDAVQQLSQLSEADHVLPFDLVISDVDMPLMNGLDLYRWINERYPTEVHKVVFYTSSNVRGLDCLGVPIIAKDGDMKQTASQISNHLSGRGVVAMCELART
jgi:CheY-like chemotaxis protein